MSSSSLSSSSSSSSYPSELNLSPPTSPQPNQAQRFSPPTSPIRYSPLSTGEFSLDSSGSEKDEPRAKHPRLRRDLNYVARSTIRRWNETLEAQAPQNLLPQENSAEDIEVNGWMDFSNNGRGALSNSSTSGSNLDAEDSDDLSSIESEFSSDSDLSASGPSGSESGNSDADADPELFPGAPVSTDEAILGLMDIYIKQRWTKTSLGKALSYLRSVIPEPNELPSSVHNLLKYVESLAPPPSVKKHNYCKDCQSVKEDDVQPCNECQTTNTWSFYEFCLKSQLKYYFEHRNLSAALRMYSIADSEELIADMKDGIEYKKVKSNLTGDYDLILLWNTDGVQMSKSSKVKIWPVLCTISQLPPHLRSSFLLVASIWCDVKDPDMNMYLKPFVDSLQEIHTEGGVEWVHPQTGNRHKSVVLAPVLCADAPAKADVLCVMRFNSKYGCNTCEQKTVGVDLNPVGVDLPRDRRKKVRRAFVFQEDAAPLRSGERMARQATVARNTGNHCKGVLGPAIVSDIPFFDRGMSVCAEYLHLLLLGVCKYFTNLMFFVHGNWFIGNKMDEINSFMNSIKVPDYVNRCPRDLSLFKYWKASEFLSWLLYYSLPAVSQHLGDDYRQHWMLLVKASFTLLKDSITQHDLQIADVMLRCFVRDVGPLYGWQYYTYNIHSLLHLRLQVERWGPLWATSAFPFENYNGVLRASLHGTKNFGQELVNNVRIVQGFQVLKNRVRGCQQNFDQNNLQSIKFSNSIPNPSLTDIEIELLESNNGDMSELEFYGRVKVNRIVYTCRKYDHNKRRANSFVQYVDENSENYGQIKYFVKQQQHILCMLHSFRIKHTEVLHHFESQQVLEHLVPVEDTGNLFLISLNVVKTKLMKVGKFLCFRPNYFETNL